MSYLNAKKYSTYFKVFAKSKEQGLNSIKLGGKIVFLLYK